MHKRGRNDTGNGYVRLSLAGHDVINEILRLEAFRVLVAKFGWHQSDCSGHMTIFEYRVSRHTLLWVLNTCEHTKCCSISRHGCMGRRDYNIGANQAGKRTRSLLTVPP